MKPLYAKKFSRNGFDIIMEAGPMECTLLDEIDEKSLEIYLIDIYVKEDEQAIMNISLAHIEKNQLKSNYDDLLWTMENGFSEVGKIVDNRINSEKLQDIKWVKENLEKWKILKDTSEEVCVVDVKDEYRKKIKNCLRE